MQITDFSVRNYRGIGDTPASISLEPKCSVLIGSNNSGKSALLAAMHILLPKVLGGKIKLASEDYHDRKNDVGPSIEVTVRGFDEEAQAHELPESSVISFGWDGDHLTFRGVDIPAPGDVHRLNRMMQRMGQGPYGGMPDATTLRRAINDGFVHKYLQGVGTALPKPVLVGSERELESGKGDEFGANIYQRLAALQHPEHEEADKEKFALIQQIVRELLRDPDLTLEVPHTAKWLNVKHRGFTLPLKSFGNGTHQAVILLASLVDLQDRLFLIEEPETNMHPEMQRQFLRLVLLHANNRLVISTHSPVFANAASPEVHVHVCRRENGDTLVERVLNKAGQKAALDHLGIRPSDLLQTNSVIWVEGPSDRVYINRWLTILAPDLVEGVHYQCLPYGGALRTHYQAIHEDACNDLINALQVNRRFVFVMDSDRTKPKEVMGRDKIRIRKECETAGSYPWVTDGRTIENYLPKTVFQKYAVTKGKTTNFSLGKHDPFTSIRFTDGTKKNYSKSKAEMSVVLAEFIERGDMPADLMRHLRKVVNHIREWNGLQAHD